MRNQPMRFDFKLPWVVLAAAAWVLQAMPGAAQSTATPISGRLSDTNGAANGSYDLTFTLFHTNQRGTAMAGPVTNSAIVVSNGVFETSVDFGAGAFNGTNSWIELGVRPTGSNVDFAALSPRQAVTPVPVALYALSAGSGNAGLAGTNGANGLNGTNGLAGTNGTNGLDGTNGVAGTAATVAITNTITADSASLASVTNLGTSSSAILQFSIPQGLPGTNGLSGTNGATGPQGNAGTAGANGANGTNGVAGANGTNGVAGAAASVAITNTLTADYASSASVTNLGTSSSAIFQFSIPQGLPGTNGANGATGPQGNAGTAGATGANGTNGTNGSAGAAATVAITNTITANYANPASVTNLGTSSSAILQFSIPQGLPGTDGANGATGPQGPAGPLLPNVALVDTNQTYTGTNQFNGVVLATNQNSRFSGTFTGSGLGLTNVSAAGVTGTFIASQIPSLDASKIATGTLALGQLPVAVVTNNRVGLTLGGTFTGNLVGNAATATLATNVVSGVRITNATIVGSSSFTGNAAGLTNMNLITANSDGAMTWSTNAGSTNYFLSLLPSATLPVGNSPRSLAVADINGDGKRDLISANANPSGVPTLTIWTNNGFGVFGSQAAATLTAGGPGIVPITVVAASMNEGPTTGDTNVDLITGNAPGNSLTIWLNNGSGIFRSNVTISVPASSNPSGMPYGLAVVDLTRDGWPDLIAASYVDSTLTVLKNGYSSDTTAWVFGSTISVGLNPKAVVATDVNSDLYLDLITANSGTNTLTVLTNNRTGGFVLSATVTVGRNPAAVAVANVNSDAKPDLIAANFGDNTLTVLTNNGTGGFVLSATVPVGSGPAAVAVADVNGDLKPDLIAANKWGNTLTVLTNNGFGVFGSAATNVTGTTPVGLAAADVTGDGLADLITVNQGSDNLTVITNASTVTRVASATNATAGFTGSFSGNAGGLTNLVLVASLQAGTIAVSLNQQPLTFTWANPWVDAKYNIVITGQGTNMPAYNIASQTATSFTTSPISVKGTLQVMGIHRTQP